MSILFSKTLLLSSEDALTNDRHFKMLTKENS